MASVMDAAVDGLRSYSELPVLQSYGIGALFWASWLIPSHFFSKAISTTYQKQIEGSVRVEWLSRCVSNLHAIFVSILLMQAIFGESSAYAGGDYEMRWLCVAGLKLAVGYFMYDAMLVLYSLKTITAGPTTLMHHALVGSIIHYTLVAECPLVIIWAAGAYLTEFSTPFVNARWFLYFRHKEEKIYMAAGALMTLSFFLARIVYMPAFLIFLFRSEGLTSTIPSKEMAFKYGIIGMGGHLGLYALNVYWFFLIAKGLMKVLKGNKTVEKKTE